MSQEGVGLPIGENPAKPITVHLTDTSLKSAEVGTTGDGPETVLRRTWRRGGFAAFICVAAAQIAIPLDAAHRAGLTTATVVALAASTFCLLASRRGPRTASLVFLGVSSVALVIEAIGVSTSFPFGSYSYGRQLQPQLLGVPAIVPLAWFAMALPAWEVARRVGSGPARWLAGGGALTAWDVFLDPQMTHERYWTWSGGGFWQGVPLSNYIGWLIVATGVMALISFLLKPQQSDSNFDLALLYAWMAGMETLGFLLPFALDRPVVGLVGGALTIPFAALGLTQRTQHRAETA